VTTLRRFLVLAALIFWQGGLTFYGAVVIPTGARVLGSHIQQAAVTREVVWVLQIAGFVTWLLFVWDGRVTRDPCRQCRTLRQVLRWGILFSWTVLCFLHYQLDQLFDPKNMFVKDPDSFRRFHRLDLWTATVQWLLCVAYLVFTLRAWRAEDQTSAQRPLELLGNHVLSSEGMVVQEKKG
jgi:hypothetical protein